MQSILKRNAVSIEGQINILNQLEKDIVTPSGYALIYWNQPDRYLHKHINYILDLCWENLSTQSERQSFGQKDWIRNKIVSVCYGNSIGQMIENDINHYLKDLAQKKNFAYSSIGEIYKAFPEESQIKIDNVIVDFPTPECPLIWKLPLFECIPFNVSFNSLNDCIYNSLPFSSSVNLKVISKEVPLL